MKRLPIAMFGLMLLAKLVGCGGSTEEEAPPTKAPEMTAEEKSNYEKQMEMMKQNRPKK